MVLFLRKSVDKMGYTVLNADSREAALSVFRKCYDEDYEILMLSENPEDLRK